MLDDNSTVSRARNDGPPDDKTPGQRADNQTFCAEDVVWEIFRIGSDAEGRAAQARFMELRAAKRLGNYLVSGGLISAEVLPG